MSGSPLLAQLIEALRALPGVGNKTAQRMAFHLLERDRDGARRLAGRLAEAADRIGNCTRCRTFSEDAVCPLCASSARDDSLLMFVPSRWSVLTIGREQTACPAPSQRRLPKSRRVGWGA